MITNIIKYAVSIPEIDDATDIENSINIFEIFIEKIKKYNIKIDNFHILIPLIHAAIYYQKMSILQKYDKINLKTIQMITSKKGGYTMLVMSKILYGEYEQYYDTLIYELGHYIQLTNDVFDIYKDLQEGVKTMANQTDIFTFEAYYLDCYDKLIKLKILQNNKLNNVKLLIYFIQIITTFHIRKIKNLNEKNYTILSRNIIVTDMEKPLVFLKFCIYALSNFSKL
ncbi:MAG: hypothetical protein NW207_04220 [Cytophagales bacterium]|nr:hypothetical protein [Cytophagales bacterium]